MEESIMKRMLALILALVTALSLAACGGGGSTQEPPSEATDTPAQEETVTKESPMLQSLVASGELPELSERLPVEADIMVETDTTPENPQFGGLCAGATLMSGTMVPSARSRFSV